MVPSHIFQDASNSKISKPTSQTIAFSNLPRCHKQQQLKFCIPKCCLSKSPKMPQTAKAQHLHPKTMPSQIFQDASNGTSSKTYIPKCCLFKSSNMPKKSKSSRPTSQNVAFPNLPRCLKEQQLKTYIPKWCPSKSSKSPQTAKDQNLHPKMLPFQIFQDASNGKSSKTYIQKYCLFKSSNMPKKAKAQNLHPKMVPFQIFQHAKKREKLTTYIPKCCPFQIFPDASNSKSSKPTSQNYIPKWYPSKFSKMPQTAKARILHLKTLPFQILQDASNSKSLKPTSQNIAFPDLPRCRKQQKLKTYIPKYCLSKSPKMPQTGKAQNLHPKMLPFQSFQDASSSKSSKPTSQNVAFLKLPTVAKCKKTKQQKLNTYIQKYCLSKSINMPKKKQKIKTYRPKCYPSKASNIRKVQKSSKSLFYMPKCCLSKSSNMPQTATAENLHPKMFFPNLPRCLKQQNLKKYIPNYCLFKSSNMPQTAKAQNLHPKLLPSQILQQAKNSKSSKPTSQNVAFPNLPSCLKQQKLKTYIPRCCLSKPSKMPQTAKAHKPTFQSVAVPNLSTCQKKQKLKTYIPKWCLSKSSKMPQAAKAQNLHPEMLPFQIFQDASNSNSSKPTSHNVAFSNLPRCHKQQKLNTYIPK